MSKTVYLIKDEDKDTAFVSLKAENVIKYLLENNVKLLFPTPLDYGEAREYKLYETEVD